MVVDFAGCRGKKSEPEQEKKMENEVKETLIADISIGSDSISRIIIKPGTAIALAEVRENFSTLSQLTPGKKSPCFIDLRGIKSITREVGR